MVGMPMPQETLTIRGHLCPSVATHPRIIFASVFALFAASRFFVPRLLMAERTTRVLRD
ncbi:MAG: hypothetical protein JWP03_881 [Phycisphaerales bacterium]|jgi:hypothetical protein|nr:hypothetical protein [Phycisphaerales bacterium]